MAKWKLIWSSLVHTLYALGWTKCHFNDTDNVNSDIKLHYYEILETSEIILGMKILYIKEWPLIFMDNIFMYNLDHIHMRQTCEYFLCLIWLYDICYIFHCNWLSQTLRCNKRFFKHFFVGFITLNCVYFLCVNNCVQGCFAKCFGIISIVSKVFRYLFCFNYINACILDLF
jgi:hypothetical protein